MWAFSIPIFLLLLLGGLLGISIGGTEEDIQVDSHRELAMYRTFVSTADAHFKIAPPPAVTTVYRWDDLRVSAPPAEMGAEMNPAWTAVRTSAGDWVACTELRDAARASVGGLFPSEDGLSTHVVEWGDGRSGVVIGAEADAPAAGDLCKGA